MKLAITVCSLAVAFVAVGEEWLFDVEAEAPRVVSCAVGHDWPTRMATHDVAAVDADGTATPVPWTLDTTDDQPELVFLAAGNHHFTLVPRSSQSSAAETAALHTGGSQLVATAMPPPDAILLEGRGIRIAFDSAANGFGCLGIENRLGDEPAAFGHAAPRARSRFHPGPQNRSSCPDADYIFFQTLPCSDESQTALMNFMPRTPSTTPGKSSSSAVGFRFACRARIVSQKLM